MSYVNCISIFLLLFLLDILFFRLIKLHFKIMKNIGLLDLVQIIKLIK